LTKGFGRDRPWLRGLIYPPLPQSVCLVVLQHGTGGILRCETAPALLEVTGVSG
jgi:hypothetical protein